MPAPTKFPDWATDGTNVVEPPGGKKAAGWVPAEEPPSSWFNWWQGVVGQWTRWLDSQVTDALSRIAAVEPIVSTLNADAARKSAANTFTAANSFQAVNATAVTAQTLHTTGAINSDTTIDSADDIHSNIDVGAGRDVYAARDFNYFPRPTHTVQIGLTTGTKANGTAAAVTFVGSEITVDPNASVNLPFRPPQGATLGVCRVKLKGASGNVPVYKLWGYRLASINMTNATEPTLPTPPTNTAASANVINPGVDYGGIVVQNDVEQYWLRIDNSSSTDPLHVLAADMTYSDPGPRNH